MEMRNYTEIPYVRTVGIKIEKISDLPDHMQKHRDTISGLIINRFDRVIQALQRYFSGKTPKIIINKEGKELLRLIGLRLTVEQEAELWDAIL